MLQWVWRNGFRFRKLSSILVLRALVLISSSISNDMLRLPLRPRRWRRTPFCSLPWRYCREDSLAAIASFMTNTSAVSTSILILSSSVHVIDLDPGYLIPAPPCLPRNCIISYHRLTSDASFRYQNNFLRRVRQSSIPVYVLNVNTGPYP